MSNVAEVLPMLANLALTLALLGGLIGSVLPGVPGASLIWIAVLFHGLLTGWHPLGLGIQLSIATLALMSLGCGFLVTALGAKRTGASLWGATGAIIGLMLGFAIPIPLLGPLLGAFGGALLAEHLATGKQGEEVLKAGAGAVIGALLGTVSELVLTLVMVVVVVLALLA